jgi:hypothetical protein
MAELQKLAKTLVTEDVRTFGWLARSFPKVPENVGVV